MAARTKQVWMTVPGIGVAMLPKLLCPLCWPLYAGVVSSVGLGFLIGTTYLLPITSAFLVVTLAVLGFGAKKRRGYRPLLLGAVASAAVLIGKFYLDSNPLVYGGVGLLVVASLWNALPRRKETAVCPSCSTNTTVQINEVRQGRS